MLQVQPGPAAVANASFTDTIVVSNEGKGAANDFILTVPFDASKVQLVSVQFSRSGAWVTSLESNNFQANLGRIGSRGDAIAVAASFAVLPGYNGAQPLTTQIGYTWDDETGGQDGSSAALLLPQTAAPAQQPSTMMVPRGGTLQVNISATFAPNERVTFWYNDPNGAVVPLYVDRGQLVLDRRHKDRNEETTTDKLVNNGVFLTADGQGAISAPFMTSGLAPGMYSLVARGNTSGLEAVIPFQIQ
jgi:hypothetical protein